MGEYVFFCKEEVFQDMVLMGKEATSPTEGTGTRSTALKPTVGRVFGEGKPPNQFPGWEKVLHPLHPVMAAGQVSPPSRGPMLGNPGEGQTWIPLPQKPSKQVVSLKLTEEGEAILMVVPPPGFHEVMTCMWRPQAAVKVSEVPANPMSIGIVSAASLIIRDKMAGVTYMDTVTTSMERVTLSGPESEASNQGPIIKDVTDQV